MTTLVAREPMDRCETTITTFVVFDAASALGQMHEGETLELLADDYEPLRRDVAAWWDAVGRRVHSALLDLEPIGLPVRSRGHPRPTTPAWRWSSPQMRSRRLRQRCGASSVGTVVGHPHRRVNPSRLSEL